MDKKCADEPYDDGHRSKRRINPPMVFRPEEGGTGRGTEQRRERQERTGRVGLVELERDERRTGLHVRLVVTQRVHPRKRKAEENFVDGHDLLSNIHHHAKWLAYAV